MTTTIAAPDLARILDALDRVKGPDSRGWYTAACIFHPDGKRPNLGVTSEGFKCLSCDAHGSLRQLAEALGLTDGFVPSSFVAYDYVDEEGALLHQTVRYENPKRFKQRRPDDRGGWVWSLKNTRVVLYRLPEVLSAADQALFVVEGEKDADRLWSLGVPATTNPMGAGKWRDEFSTHLRNRVVVILPDNDDAGRKHAEQVARSLHGVAEEVRIVELRGLPEKGDLSDWLDAGGKAAELLDLARTAPLFEPSDVIVEPASFPRSDAGNGELFAHLYSDRVRFDHRRRIFFTWRGNWWSADADAEVRRLAKLAARHRMLSTTTIEDLLERQAAARFAIQSENRQRQDAMLALAQSEVAIADRGDRWNLDPMLLGVANGVVDLRTGELRPGRPTDRITFHSSVSFDPSAVCPRWLQFLDEVFSADAELIGFIHRAVGYSLTGLTTEQCVFLCHGKGANGKSVFLSVLRAMAGDYGHNAPFSLFELNNRTQIPNDLAALVDRRLVTSSETNEGTRLNEARFKALTGSDAISARFLHAEWFTFEPVAKYWLAVNHKPHVLDESEGMWRRVRLIPFLQQFTAERQDRGLREALEAELPGILAWAVLGAVVWRTQGLGNAEMVRRATDSYRLESDPLAGFLEDRCLIGAAYSCGSSELFKAYQAWCCEQGMKDRETLTSTIFGKRVASKFEKKHTRAGNRYVGIGLLSERPDPSPPPLENASSTPEDVPEVPGAGDVKGSVKGLESVDTEIQVFSLENSVTQENLQQPFTTLHRVTEPAGEPCRGGCGTQVAAGRKCSPCADAAVAKWKATR